MHSINCLFSKIAKWLIKRGAKIDTLCDYPDTDVALFGSTSTATFDDDQYHRLPLVSKITPLMLAICRCDYGMARTLIDHGASINARSSDRLTPLMFAVKQVLEKSGTELCIPIEF